MASQVPPRVLVAVAVTVVAWASAFVVIRFAGHAFSPGALALGRLLVASAVLSLLMIGRRWVRPNRREWVQVTVIGLAWYGLYFVALNAGERLIDAGTAAMLIQLAPILVGILAGAFLGEGFPRRLVVGGLVAFAGTLVIGFATRTGQADAIGVLLVLVSALSYAVAMVVQKSVLRRLPALQVTWLACVIGTLGCVGFLPSLIRDLEAAPVQSSLGVLYLGLVPTALAFTTWAYALSRVSAGQLGVTTYLVPPITIGLAWLLLGEVPSLLAVAGGVLSLVGVAVTRTRGRRPADAAPVVEVSAGR